MNNQMNNQQTVNSYELQKKERENLLKKIIYYEETRPDNVTKEEYDKMMKLLWAHKRQLDSTINSFYQ